VSAGAEITATTNARRLPALSAPRKKSDGTGRIDIVITANDANQDNLQAKVEFLPIHIALARQPPRQLMKLLTLPPQLLAR